MEAGSFFLFVPYQYTVSLTLYSILTPLKYHIFENILENKAYALLEQMHLNFS